MGSADNLRKCVATWLYYGIKCYCRYIFMVLHLLACKVCAQVDCACNSNKDMNGVVAVMYVRTQQTDKEEDRGDEVALGLLSRQSQPQMCC